MRTIGLLVGTQTCLSARGHGAPAYYAFRMPDVWSRAAVLLSALPIGSGPFTIAKLYSLDAGATSGAILASHLGSLATVSLLVAWLG
jgi:malonate transporter